MIGQQIKAARGLLSISQADLCARAGVPLITLRRVEGKSGHAGKVSDEAVERIKAALVDAGVDFIPENGGGAGVRMRDRSDHAQVIE